MPDQPQLQYRLTSSKKERSMRRSQRPPGGGREVSGRPALAIAAEADHATEMLDALPRRIHQILESPARELANRPALIDDNATWTYRELHRAVGEVAEALVRKGTRLN